MQLGDPSSDRTERSRVDVALDETQQALTTMIGLLEAGGLDQLSAGEKVSWWQRFESSRNRLPLIDHQMIADAEATDLPGSYGFSSLSRFLTRILQLSPALQVPPHPLPAERLELPHQRRRTTGMDPALLDRPRPTTPTQHPNPPPMGPTAKPTPPKISHRRMIDSWTEDLRHDRERICQISTVVRRPLSPN
jgi:hypothetical protein